MPVFEITLSIKRDNVEVFGAPLRRRLEVDEAIGPMEYEQATGGGYVVVPGTSALDEINVLILRAVDYALTVRLDAQSDAGIVLNAGGVLVIFDADIDAGASLNVKVDNSSGSTASAKVLAGGT
jgi:hypothetical protein